MAKASKKAKKKLGRPPGSKSPQKMDAGQLRSYIDGLETLLTKMVHEQQAYFEGKLSELSGYTSAKAAGTVRAVMRVPRTGKRKKAEPKYRSKKHPKLVWSGRGMLAGWLRDEMKALGKPREFFLIAKPNK